MGGQVGCWVRGWLGGGGSGGGSNAQWISLTSIVCYDSNKNVTSALQQMLPLKHELRFFKVIFINVKLLEFAMNML